MTEKDVKLKAIFKLEAKSCSKEKNNCSNIQKDNIMLYVNYTSMKTRNRKMRLSSFSLVINYIK